MYEADTILALKEPRDPDPETGEEFAYNRVRVVGESPVSHPDKGNWTGADARGVVLLPLTNFGGNLDYPFGRLRELYDVESIPEHEAPANPVRVVKGGTASVGPTPEEVFATEAPGEAPKGDEPRARTKPLGELGGPKDATKPLD